MFELISYFNNPYRLLATLPGRDFFYLLPRVPLSASPGAINGSPFRGKNSIVIRNIMYNKFYKKSG